VIDADLALLAHNDDTVVTSDSGDLRRLVRAPGSSPGIVAR
jgi:hypothetical protein